MTAIVSANDLEDITPEMLARIEELDADGDAGVTGQDVGAILDQAKQGISALLDARLQALVTRYEADIARWSARAESAERRAEELGAQLGALERRLEAYREWVKGFEALA